MAATTKQALTSAAVVAAACGFLAAPDLVTQILTATGTFAVITVVLLICLRLFPVNRWPLARQRTFIWSIAAAIGVFIALLPTLMRSPAN